MISIQIGWVAGITYTDGHEWLSSGDGHLANLYSDSVKVFLTESEASKCKDQLSQKWDPTRFAPFVRPYHKEFPAGTDFSKDQDVMKFKRANPL